MKCTFHEAPHYVVIRVLIGTIQSTTSDYVSQITFYD
jgi:hypothetical protein